jgi:hypothetical protein
LKDCETLYSIQIETITAIGEKYSSIEDVWIKNESLNVANGAICSSLLKRKVRERFQKENQYTYQVFGFEFEKSEMNRAISMKDNHPKSCPIFPLIMFGLSKKDCIEFFKQKNIEIPNAYKMGFNNNNCLKTGCVQGGVGYWQKMKIDFPDRFLKMAKIEHELSEIRGYPVTMLKDQSNEAKLKDKKDALVFLIKNPAFPNNKCIDDLKAQEVKPLTECNGFCGTNMYNKKNNTILELNFESI